MKTLTVLTIINVLALVLGKAPGLNKNSPYYNFANSDGILTWDGLVH